MNTHTVTRVWCCTLLCYSDNRSAVGVKVHNKQHNNASLRKCIWRKDVFSIFTMRLIVGVIWAMVEKELGERNLGFDSLKSRLNRDMEEKGIVAHDCFPGLSPAGALLPAAHKLPIMAGNNPFLLHVMVQSILQFDPEVEEPETSENPTQSIEIHNILRRRTQLLAVIIYRLYPIDISI